VQRRTRSNSSDTGVATGPSTSVAAATSAQDDSSIEKPASSKSSLSEVEGPVASATSLPIAPGSTTPRLSRSRSDLLFRRVLSSSRGSIPLTAFPLQSRSWDRRIAQTKSAVAVISRSEPFVDLQLVLKYTFVKIAGHSDVEGVASARHHVREIASFVHGKLWCQSVQASMISGFPPEKATAGPSTSLRFAQDDSSIGIRIRRSWNDKLRSDRQT